MSNETASESPGFPPLYEAHARMTASFWRDVAADDGPGALVLVQLSSYRQVGERYGIHPGDALIAALERVLDEAMGAARARTRLSFNLWAAYFSGADAAATQATMKLDELVAARPTVEYQHVIAVRPAVEYEDVQLPLELDTAVVDQAAGEAAEALYERARETAQAAFTDAVLSPGLEAHWSWLMAQSADG